MRRRDKQLLDWAITAIILAMLVCAAAFTLSGCVTSYPVIDAPEYERVG